MSPGRWDRRRFIKSTAASATVAALAGESVISRAAADSPVRTGLVLYDPESADSVRFAKKLMEQGALGFSTDPDIGRAWMGSVGATYAACGGNICGLTQYSDLMISRIFARDIAGGRLSFEGLHDHRPGKRGGHRLRIGAPWRGVAANLSAAGADWAVTLAGALRPMTAAGELTEEWCASSRFSTDHRGSLFSWVITKPQ